MKIFFTYSSDVKEGFESRVPMTTSTLADDSVENITVEGVLERIPNLVEFIEECYRLLQPQGILTVSAKYYGSANAWLSPLAIRGVSEASLNFASKEWREQTKFTEVQIRANFSVVGNVGIADNFQNRSMEFRDFSIKHYLNIVQVVLFTLTKLEP